MSLFTPHKISQNTDKVGEELRQARIDKNLPIAEAADILNINVKYLKTLESGQWDSLPAGIYGKNFLREYALFLDINADNLASAFDNEILRKPGKKQKDPFSRKMPHFSLFLSAPKIIKNVIILTVVLVCAAYLGYCLKEIVSPPRLSIISPADNYTTPRLHVDIRGATEPEAEVVINGEPVLINTNGQFSKIINLKNGLNTISVTAKKKYSKESSIVKKILVKN